MFSLHMLTLVYLIPTYVLAVPIGDASISPISKTVQAPSPVSIYDLRQPFASGEKDPMGYLKRYDPLRYSRSEMQPPRINKMERDMTEAERAMVEKILDKYPPGAAYVIFDGLPVPVRLPTEFWDCEYACGKVKVYRSDGTLIKETGCCHTNCGCITRDILLILADCLAAIIDANNKQHDQKYHSSLLPYSPIYHWQKLARDYRSARVIEKSYIEKYNAYLTDFMINVGHKGIKAKQS
ncbi:hypothetical protein PGT21_003928 [Puccinia graminis f. sp. tritici]|uniref:Secreted protein n=1 Tax=Puccinia graminis f. sp. tritici TaxID=56615 RepID=A0A5B0MRN9_PUCGR|nr:hypothetical protein PGT21_003928 [Puccinia graminis f. sp. tritici]